MIRAFCEENMNEKALKTLEFNKITQRLADLAITPAGKELCLTLVPFKSLKAVENAQQETEEALFVLSYQGKSPVTYFSDVRPHLISAQKGAILSLRALLEIAEVLRVTRSCRSALVSDNEHTQTLAGIAAGAQPMRSLENDLSESILNEEELADGASSELMHIRRQLRIINDRVKDKLNSLIRQPSFAKYLQEPIVTVRNGRYVIPVRQEYRQMVQGLVHDQSSSGATLFIEPMALVELGNDLKQWKGKEEQEIERILAAFSSQIADVAPTLEQNVEVLSFLDFIFAKGRLASEMNAVRPLMNDRKYFRLVGVKHPLLDQVTAVPCDMVLGDTFTTLVITGPNTGGKTVSLKTAGLMTLMAQSGLQIPGQAGTELSVFSEVFADIGDEQSIEQSLSTFSSHMTNIVRILDEVEDDCLVLFDELGAGTDPTEGAALAQAILTRLKRRNIRTIATTHYSELKAYALTTPGVENASVEFDITTLRPTFRLLIGLPGKSNAFEIAKRLGLPVAIINDAQTLLSGETVRFEDVIATAQQHRIQAEKESQKAQQLVKDREDALKEAEEYRQKTEEKYRQAAQKARQDARKLVDKTRKESADLIRELKDMLRDQSASGGRISDVSRRLGKIEKEIDGGDVSIQRPLLDEIRKGDHVRMMAGGTPATVLTDPDNKNEVQILAGNIKMTVPVHHLEKINKKPKKQKTVVRTSSAMSRKVSLECDLRGMNLDEALLNVDRFLDNALLNGLNEVTIIHGKGTGVLKEGVNRHLRSHPAVKSFRGGLYGEGEAGVTVVNLK
jgi:DNA mismatch repair protein MutS2